MFIDADSHYAHKDIFNSISDQDWLARYLENNHIFFSHDIKDFHNEAKQKLNVDHHLLNIYGPSMGLMYDVDPELAVELMHHYNNGMISLCHQYKKFDTNLWLALQDIEQSLKEIDKADNSRVFGIHFGDQIPWGFLPALDPVFAKLEKMRIPVYLHFANSFDIAPGWADTLNNNVQYQQLKQHWSVYSDTWRIAIASLLINGLFDRYPALRVVVAERGISWISDMQKYLLDQFNIDTKKYFRQNLWFTTEVEADNFLNDVKQLGWDRLLFATDWPHHDDAGGINSEFDTTMTEDFLNDGLISPAEYQMFTHQNYLKLQTRLA